MKFKRGDEHEPIQLLEVRFNMKLGLRCEMSLNEVLRRAFRNLPQFVTAHRCRAKRHAKKRRILFVYQPYDFSIARSVLKLFDRWLVKTYYYTGGLGFSRTSLDDNVVERELDALISLVDSVRFLIGPKHLWQEWLGVLA